MSVTSRFSLQGMRFWLVSLLLAGAGLLLLWRIVHLQVIERDFLAAEGDLRTIRVQPIYSSRGNIFDRNQEPLAISVPAFAVYVNPDQIDMQSDALTALAEVLELDPARLHARLDKAAQRRFLYLARQVTPEVAQAVTDLDLNGVYTERSARRFYPTAEVTSHVVGFTNIDNRGQEGMELIYDQWLSGQDGSRRVMIDAKRRVIQHLSVESPARPGNDLRLSIDLRLQFYAYRELKAAVQAHKAESGALVLMDVRNGELLSVVSQPGFNPNDRSMLRPERVRNRALTDAFEPGSTVKPLTLAAGLDTRRFALDSTVDTAPGFLRIGGKTIRDTSDHGLLDVTGVLVKSSNVGTSKLAMVTGGEAVWAQFHEAGFGQPTGIEFPGEGLGALPNFNDWKPLNLATFSYGYGLSVTTLQLAQVYAAIANDGVLKRPTFLASNPDVASRRVMSSEAAEALRIMLEKTVLKGGTGTRAQTADYRVAGKTGTAHKVGVSGYADDRYLAVFAGFAPVSQPRLAMVVVISAPSSGEYYGGEVAAPVFSRVMTHALRVINAEPDRERLPTVAGRTRAGVDHG